MWGAIIAIIQLIGIILKTKFENDAIERKRKDDALKGWKEAVVSGDAGRINSVIDGVRK